MKILYVAPEHVSGTLSLFKREHERRGDTCRYITFWHSRSDFPDDICLNLGGMPDRAWVRALRKAVTHDPDQTPSRIVNGMIPEWSPNPVARALFAIRDELNWRTISRAIEEYDLFGFDVLHLDGGCDFTRDSRFARAFKNRSKGVVAYYHGSDLRSRGYIPAVDKITDLRLTPEWDLAAVDERLHYLYLPVNVDSFEYKPYAQGKTIRIGHAARNAFKGTPAVLSAVEHLRKKMDVELVLIRGMSYQDALTTKRSCDIFIDQLTNEAGWGYGMSGVEAIAMGIPVVTNIPEAMRPLINEHPFIQAEPDSLLEVLEKTLSDPARLKLISEYSREWALERHSVSRVAEVLYGHYERLGWQ